MNVLNFSHPLTPPQLEQLNSLLGESPEQVLDVPVQFDTEQPFAPQVIAMLDALPVTAADWHGGGWLVVLPALNHIAAVLLAEIHGRTGHFPAIVRLKPVAGAVVTTFMVAEIINLEQVRSEARARR